MLPWERIGVFFLVLLFCACASKKEGLRKPLDPGKILGYKEVGLASWYGGEFHGRKTACGEIYDMDGPTAAHRTLPFHTRVRVTNLENGRKTEVRINDRGPFVSGRIIDLSHKGAQAIGLLGPGTAKVSLEAIGYDGGPAPSMEGTYAIQVGSFAERENALRFQEELGKSHRQVHIVLWESNFKRLYRVRLGAFRSEDEARNYAEKLRQENLPGLILRED
jgi:rare lipoprotein A